MTTDWTWHGGALAAAQQRFGGGDAPWIDLSTGINPHPWPGAETIAIDWRRLPEREAIAALEASAAAAFGLDARHVCAVPGSEIGLRLIGRLIGGRACHVAPGYRTHGAMIAGSVAADWPAIRKQAGTLILANPGNPDGRIVESATIGALLDRRAPADWLVIDEAYADCDPAISAAPRIRDDARLIVFRSFGKFFGLAGVRLGFVLGPRALLAELRALVGAWPVSAAAVAIGTTAYRDADWIARTRIRLAKKAAALDTLLIEAGFQPRGDCPLFRLVETPDAAALFERLARAAILTRPFDSRPDWLRIGLPRDAAARARLAAALADG